MGSSKRAKLDDVAQLAGVSKTTVSRVLNKRGYLSQKTIDKVYAAMKELNYQPNTIARQLFKQQTNMVGLIFPTVNNPFFGQLVAKLEQILYERGYKVLIGNSQNDPKKEEDYLNQLLVHQVDGLIVGAHNRGLKEYQHTNLPIVSIDRIMNDDIPVVSSDNYQGGKMATEALIKAGCQTIIHTDGPENLESNTSKRQKAYEDVMRQNGRKPVTYNLDFNIPTDEKIKFFRKIFEDNPNVDGIVTSNDTDAATILFLAPLYNKNVPHDLKIIGYDGADMTRLMLPHLSTIQQPINELAQIAVDLLEEKISGKKPSSPKPLKVKFIKGLTS